MNYRFIVSLFFLMVLGCSQPQKKASSLLDFVPQNAAIVIKINHLDAFKSDLKNNEFLPKLGSFGVYKSVTNQIKHLVHLNTESESLLTFSQLGADNFEFTFVTQYAASSFMLDSVQNSKKENVLIAGQQIDKYDVEGDILYSIVLDGNIAISSSKVIIENLIKYFDKRNRSPELEKLYEIASATKNASIFINLEESEPLSKSLVKENSALKGSNFSDWMLLDINISQNHINLNGISIAEDTITNYVNLFRDTNPLASITPGLAPRSADAILSYTFDDYGTFAKNQQQYLKAVSPKDSLLNNVEEIGVVYRNGSKTIILNTYGSEELSTYITNNKRSETEYQGNQILALNNPDFLSVYLNPLVTNFKANYFTVIENAFVFGENIGAVQAIINSTKNGATFEKTDVYASAKDALADESSILFVSTAKGIEQLMAVDFSNGLLADFKKAKFNKNTFAAQLVADQGFFHSTMIIQQTGRKSKINTVSPLFTLQLDADLATKPQFVMNHRTNKKELVVQDQENNLYLISTQGKVLWKKQLQGQVQGKIHQVDIYKNRRLQLAFTTNDQFLILDRNGKEVAPFTKKFEGGNLNPLAVFDYENKKDYRFLVTQGNKVFMYNNKAAIVNGFKYTEAESPILQAPKHLVMANKDYLVFTLENGELKILNRVGDVRTRVDQKIDFSQNEVFLYKNKFVITDKKGVLHQIAANGKLSTSNLRMNEDHGIDATSKTFVSMNDNVLSIRGKKVELDFGVYSRPKIFYIYDKIYVAVTDIQNQKVYLYDSQAVPIKNFPVFGSSSIDMADMELDRKLEIVTQDQKNSIIVYQLN